MTFNDMRKHQSYNNRKNTAHKTVRGLPWGDEVCDACFPITVHTQEIGSSFGTWTFLGEKYICRLRSVLASFVSQGQNDSWRKQHCIISNPAALIQQTTTFKNKNNRKVLDVIYVYEKGQTVQQTDEWDQRVVSYRKSKTLMTPRAYLWFLKMQWKPSIDLEGEKNLCIYYDHSFVQNKKKSTYTFRNCNWIKHAHLQSSLCERIMAISVFLNCSTLSLFSWMSFQHYYTTETKTSY